MAKHFLQRYAWYISRRILRVYYRLGGQAAVLEIAQKRAGGAYDPHLAQVLCDHIGDIFDITKQDNIWDTVIESEPLEPLLLGRDAA